MQSDVFAWQHHLVPIQKCEVSFPIKKSNSSIKKIQLSLVLFWACAIHKVQEFSLKKKGLIGFYLQRQKSFSQGQMYVVLSRYPNLITCISSESITRIL